MRKFTGLLTASVLAAYGLLALGAVTAATGAGSFAAGHVVAAVAVGVFLGIVAGIALLSDRDRYVRWGTTVAFLGYAGQASVGLAGVAGAPVFGGRVHLFGGVTVFALLLATLVWHLERDVQSSADRADGPAETSETDTLPSDEADVSMTSETTPDSAMSTAEPQTTTSVAETVSTTGRIKAYVSLTKPRLMWLLGLLALAGMALATVTGATLDGVTVVATVAGGFLAVGAAGTFNHVYERDRDSEMDRTADRPVATAVVGPRRATLFGVVLFAASMTLLLVAVNVFAALLTAVAVVYYAVLYTVVLKPSTVWNTVLGGGAGALPAVIGWVAVTGSVGLPAVVLAAVVFCWTPAHFYNLAIVYREEYANAGYPMAPVVEGVPATRRRVVYWLGLTLLGAAGLGVVAEFGPVYVGTVVAFGFVFLWTVVNQFEQRTDSAAYRSFHASNAFLGTLLLAVVVETILL